jgi:hypothetical protein
LTGTGALGEIVNRITGGKKSAPPALLQIPGWNIEGLSCSQLVAIYEQRLFFPQLDDPTGSVLVINPLFLNGKHFKTLLICGFVNGFIPAGEYFDRVETSPQQRTKLRNRSLRMISLMLGSALENLILTWFERIDLLSAERLNLSIKKIRAVDGERICAISPSELLDIIVP